MANTEDAGARLRALVAELVAKLDAVRNDPQYIGVWTLAHIHGYNYTGLTYTNELQAVKDALLSAPVVSPHDYHCQVSAKARGELSDAICTCGLAYAVERIAREPRGPMVIRHVVTQEGE